MTRGGRIAISAEHQAAIASPDQVESVDPSNYHFRSTPSFRAPDGSPRGWLSSIVGLGMVRLVPSGARVTR